MCGGVDEEFHAFLTSTLHIGGCTASLCGRVNPLLRILGGTQNRYEGCGEDETLKSMQESNAIQHSSILKASCYTDRAIPAFGCPCNQSWKKVHSINLNLSVAHVLYYAGCIKWLVLKFNHTSCWIWTLHPNVWAIQVRKQRTASYN